MRRRASLQLSIALTILVMGRAAYAASSEISRQRTATVRCAGVIVPPKQQLDFVLPEVNFRDADLEHVVSYLAQKASVNIIIDPIVYMALPSALAGSSPPIASPVASPPSRTPPEQRVPSPTLGKITLRLKNVPLKVVLKYALRYKNLRYTVDDYAIVIVPVGWVPQEEVVTRVFRLRGSGFPVPKFFR